MELFNTAKALVFNAAKAIAAAVAAVATPIVLDLVTELSALATANWTALVVAVGVWVTKNAERVR